MVKINNVVYNYVTDIVFSHADYSFYPKWLNQMPVVDTKFWIKNAQKITYTIQLNDLQKWQIMKTLSAHSFIIIDDNVNRTYHLAFLLLVKSSDSHEKNFNLSWESKIDVLSIWDSKIGYFGFHKFNDVTGFNDKFHRTIMGPDYI